MQRRPAADFGFHRADEASAGETRRRDTGLYEPGQPLSIGFASLSPRLTNDKHRVHPAVLKVRPMKPGIIERALELAAESRSVDEVRKTLKAEGYSSVAEHLSGKFIRRQIVERLLPSEKARRVR